MPGEGPTWLSGLTVLEDASGRERMFAFYAKIRKQLEVYERGLAEFNPQIEPVRESHAVSRTVQVFRASTPTGIRSCTRTMESTTSIMRIRIHFCAFRADPDLLKEPTACEAYTCLAPGTRLAQQRLDRTSGRQASLRLEGQHAARAAGSAGQADRSPAHDRRRVAA